MRPPATVFDRLELEFPFVNAKQAIRPAVPADVDRAAGSLGRAFSDYPFTRHTVAADGHHERVASLQRIYLDVIGLQCGRVWVSDDVAAVAVWLTPSSVGVGEAFESVAERIEQLHGDRSDIARRADEATESLKPSEPVWLLATVGVDPSVQGQGLGRAVLEPGLLQARKEGCPAYLETSSTANLDFYAGLGFRVTGSVQLSDGGPEVWAMLRA